MKVKPSVESEILAAIKKLHKETHQARPIINRSTIAREMMENARKYPAVRPYDLTARKKQITYICNLHFEKFSLNWRNCAWVVPGECLT